MNDVAREPGALLARMSKRERVLKDQADMFIRGLSGVEATELVTLDIESNGLQHESYPVEIGYAIGTGADPYHTCSFLIRPRPEWNESECGLATPIHGIDPALIRGAIDADLVCDLLDFSLKDKIVTVDGGIHDQYWIKRLYAKRSPSFSLIELPSDVKERVDAIRRESSPIHRALPDAVWLYRAVRIAEREGETK